MGGHIINFRDGEGRCGRYCLLLEIMKPLEGRGFESLRLRHKSTVIYYGGLFLCHKMLNNKNFRLFRYIVSPEAKASRSDTGSFQAWCRSIFRALLSVSPIDIQSVPPCCGIAGVEVLCSADCCRPVCPAGPFHRSVVLR